MSRQKNRISLHDQPIDMTELISQTAKTLPLRVSQQLKDKYRTFTTFNYRKVAQENRASKRMKKQFVKTPRIVHTLANFITSTINSTEGHQKNTNAGTVTEDMAGIKSERRERLKKANNSMLIIKYYIQKEGFKPSQQQRYLLKSLTQLKQFSEHNSLDSILKRIYRFMNEAVDFNQLRFLCLLIIMAADLCYQFKDYNRAFYFYNQTRLFASYSSLYAVKTQALLGIAIIANELKFYSEAITFFKKALQFAWKIKSIQHELLIYDYIGNALYYQGQVNQAKYYHRRFSQGNYEENDSAIKRISAEMVQQYQAYLSSLERKNLTSLFLEYINIPIVDLASLPPAPQEKRRVYENYDQEGLSPRKRKGNKKFEFQDFPQVSKQIERLLNEDQEFRRLIPNPDVQQIFVPAQRFGRYRKSIAFEQSSQYHKIVGYDRKQKIDLSKTHAHSIEKKIEQMMSERQNPDWWGEMKDKIRQDQSQKLGDLRERIRNSHQSYNKYADQRRRSYSLRNEKVKQSYNKTLLDWIDPLK